MISNLAHTIGTADGSAGIAFFNWSKVAGDLRSAHFITLHGLQAIPLFAFFISDQTNWPRLYATLFFVLYGLTCVRLHQVALVGHSLICSVSKTIKPGPPAVIRYS